MSFADLLDQIGSMGRFQRIFVVLLACPIFMMASHMVMQNFTAATPDHHCLIAHNSTILGNRSLSTEELLRVSIPVDLAQQHQQCLRFVSFQWQLLDPNGTNVTGPVAEMEPCTDGWTYNRSTFRNTIITEVRPKVLGAVRRWRLCTYY